MSLLVIGDLLGQLGNKVWPFRTWANKAHLPLQDVPELRDLVYADLTNDAANTGCSVVTFTGPPWSSFLGINSHGAKFRQHKMAAVFADALLFVEDRAAGIDFYKDGSKNSNGQRNNSSDQRHQPVQRTANKGLHPGLATTTC